jgi:hypothetical protein
MPIGDLPSGRESKPYRSAEAVPAGCNEGEAQALGVVEAKHYLDSPYNEATSGWQLEEELRTEGEHPVPQELSRQ